jgi:hypothetical protein
VIFALLSVRIVETREDFGVRWQLAEAKRSEDWSAAATPLFDCGQSFQSGVAPALRIGVNLSFGMAATFFHFLNARENQGVFIFQRPFPLLAFLEVNRLG